MSGGPTITVVLRLTGFLINCMIERRTNNRIDVKIMRLYYNKRCAKVGCLYNKKLAKVGIPV